MFLADAIDHYHELLLSTDMARESWATLSAEMRARRLFFSERPLSSVLRPRLISAAQYALLQRAVGDVARAARKVADLALTPGSAGAAVREQLMLTPHEHALIDMHPGYADPSAHARMDTFLTLDGSLQFAAYNAENPASVAYEDLLSQAFREMPVMRAFTRRYPLRPLPTRQRMIETLLGAWREADSPGGEPSVAILAWSGLPTTSEFELFRDFLAEHHLPALICTPDDLRFHAGRLFARIDGAETPITIVLKRVLTSEFLVHYGDEALAHPLAHAYAAGACVVVNSFRATLLHKTSIFALLSDEQCQADFSIEERDSIARHIPWTRVLRPGVTTYQGDPIDLLDFTRANRNRLLLKPNDTYDGKDITIGWESSTDEWDAAIKAGMESPCVVQEKVMIAYEPYPALVDGHVVISQRLVESDPFLFGPEVDGCLCRLSPVTQPTVSAGGGSTVPVFVIDEG